MKRGNLFSLQLFLSLGKLVMTTVRIHNHTGHNNKGTNNMSLNTTNLLYHY